MATTSAVSMAMPLTQKRAFLRSESSLFRPLPMRPSNTSPVKASRFEVKASMKEKVVTGLTAGVLTASMMIPDVAEAAQTSSLSPTLQNFLFSIAAGGVVLTAIIGAVVGVSNFDPVKRG
ncbi:hypothetical protein ACFE04_016414 [Oxalis oulophora]